LGRPLLVRTRYGVRYLLVPQDVVPDGESHRDVTLSIFADIGLPLSTSIETADGLFSVKDLLSDSLATFDPHEKEIAWTANAYCLYLHRPEGWQNRDGERFSFDNLSDELLNRDLSKESCGGTHILMAMTSLTRVNAQYNLLSPERAKAVQQRIRACVTAAIMSQAKDGSWTLNWDSTSKVRPAYMDALFLKVLVTGHLLEWMEYLPKDMQPPEEVYRRAADWLCIMLPQLQTGQFEVRFFCPWTHGVCAIRNLVSPAKQS
jgi:hypothetical protein